MTQNLRSLTLLEKLCKVPSTLLMESIVLQEGKIEDIYNKYYSKIPFDTFQQIVKADPSTKLDGSGTIQKMGGYTKWLLSLFASNNLKLEDLGKAKEYLTTFAKFNGELPIEQRDIAKYRKLPELFQVIQPYQGQKTKGEQIRDIKGNGAKKLYEDGEWLVLLILTEEAAKFYGKGTQWCTSGDENNMFNEYHKDGDIYMNIHKADNTKYQFHFESKQFMNENDDEIDPEEVLSPAVIQFYNQYRGKTGRIVNVMLNQRYQLSLRVGPDGAIQAVASDRLIYMMRDMINSPNEFVREFFSTLPRSWESSRNEAISTSSAQALIKSAEEKSFPVNCLGAGVMETFHTLCNNFLDKLQAMGDNEELLHHFYSNLVPKFMNKAMTTNNVDPGLFEEIITELKFKWTGLENKFQADNYALVNNPAVWAPLIKPVAGISVFNIYMNHLDSPKLEDIFRPIDATKMGQYIKKELGTV